MKKALDVKILAEHAHSKARVLEVTTAHGQFISPVFMPVGTRAGVNNMMPDELIAADTQVILGGNTYHMLSAPGMRVIEEAGGMHQFMGWDGPMLTDSGGFQVFSLSKQNNFCQIDEYGAHFVLPHQNSTIHMTPKVSLETQKIIGADMIMAFDQCTPDDADKAETKRILDRTHRWLLESLEYHTKNPNAFYGYPQALFGIIQGGLFESFRIESAEFITKLPLDGIALGGETVGFDMPKTQKLIQWVYPLLPKNKPRYTMGVGMSPQDLLDVVAEGIDMFDCVAPTRNARHGALYCGAIIESGRWLQFKSDHSGGRIHIKKACYANDFSPIMPNCNCYTCVHHSRAFLHDLYKKKAVLFTALASIHNVHVMHATCLAMRNLILKDS